MENIIGVISQSKTERVQLKRLSDYSILEVFDVSKESSNHSDALVLSFSLDSVPKCPFTGEFTGAYQKHTWIVLKGNIFGKESVYRILWLIYASLLSLGIILTVV